MHKITERYSIQRTAKQLQDRWVTSAMKYAYIYSNLWLHKEITNGTMYDTTKSYLHRDTAYRLTEFRYIITNIRFMSS